LRVPARTRGDEEWLGLFFELRHDLACVVDGDGCFDRINACWEACLGWKPVDLQGRRFLDIVHPADRAATAAELCKIASGVVPTVGFENRFRSKDGAVRRLQWNAVFSPQRRVICAAARDVTDEKRLERELIEAGDREKERIGRELHDGLCQNLAGIAALSATLARKLAVRADLSAAAAADLTLLLQQSVGDARDLARGLNSAGLTQMGLAVALEALTANVKALHFVACAFTCDRSFPRLDPVVEAHLYRIAQESVNNVVAHARASRIDVSLRIRGRQASLRIRDNGVGIPQRLVDVGGNGLRTMQYRAHLIGACLQVQRASPHGTLVVCKFPLTSKAAERRHAGPGV
jgi:PAS domain S-box-containing protein